MITRDEVWQRVQNLNVWRRGKQRAPHKPLLLRLSLSRLTQRLPRLATFAELEDPLKQLLIRYGPPRQSQHPFKSLRNALVSLGLSSLRRRKISRWVLSSMPHRSPFRKGSASRKST
jgi:hypothetical protein